MSATESGAADAPAEPSRDVALEDEERRAGRALREAQLRLRFILDASHIGEWEADLPTGHVSRSLQHDRCFGYTELAPDWSIDTFLAHVHPDDRNEVQQRMKTNIATADEWNYECRVVWPDRSIHWIRASGSTIRDGIKPVRLVGIIADVTPSRLAEAARIKAARLEAENRQIQEANRLKSRFLADMSHELRTPLNAIIGFADLLQSGAIPADSPKVQEFIGYIGTSGRHLLQLINDVLDLSKVEAGKLEFFPGRVDLATLLKEVADILQPSVQRKRIELSVEVDASLGALILDPARLKQVLFNYLSNAIKFTPNQGRVWVRARRADEAHLRIEVEDTGIGIAAADMPRLFSEFHQINAGVEDENGGTGLGLALTRRLVEAQGGSVGATSTPGRGSVFYLVLNCVHGTDQVRTAGGGPAGRESRQRRLLMIEDPAMHQSGHAAALAKAGFAVDAPATGEQAFQYAQLRAYDAMTVNLERRHDAGLELLAQIRRRGARRECPVVGLSMPAPAGGEVTFAITDMLSKPMQTDEIVSAMSAFRFPPPRRATIMVIDDDLVSLALMQATLAAIDIDAIRVQGGREAFASLNRQLPDAIILDLLMPELDGFEVLDVLRSRPDWRDIPVFIWTSMILTETEYARLAQSAHAIVSKGGGTIHAMLEDLQRRYHPVNGAIAEATVP